MKKDIKLSVVYKGDLSKMKDDVASLKSIRRQLESTPIKLCVRLDLSGIKSDAVKAAQAYQAELTKAMGAVKPGTGGGSLSKGGILVPPGALAELKNFREASGRELKSIEKTFENSKQKVVKTFEQLQRGLARETTISTNKKGATSKSTSIIDTRPLEEFKRAMEQIESRFGPQLGAAKGNKGDVASILAQKKQAIDAKLTEFANLEGSPAYQQARKSLVRLDQTLSQTGASQSTRAAAEAKRNYKTFAERTIHNDDRKLQADLKLNKGDEAAAKSIQDRLVREQELNRVLDDREKLIARQQQRYQELERSAKSGGHGEAANQFHNAAARMGNDLGQIQLDRKRATSGSSIAESTRDLDRLLSQSLRYNDQQRAALNIEEKQARLIQNRYQREAAINDILARRRALTQDTRDRVSDIHGEATRRGSHAIAGKAESAGSRLHQTAIRDTDRLTEATNRSTHANQFHSSSLIRNAVSFTRWTLAMTAVTMPLAALSAGISDAVKLERTFKTLNAVFRGSREDAKLLAQQTLQLAAANGRDGQEAAEAAIAWSRLGLTRTQVLMAVETSLRAANVAEITAAEATGYLTAAYKSFHQTILDIPQTLDYLNSLSNSNADKVKDMFNAIARGGKVAGDAGLSLQRFAAISATVGEATQRPGAEFGNASKSIFNRIRKPETLAALKKDFDLDFSTPTGEVQDMDQILLKLADTYANLNATQKANLTLLIAGSNQSNRAATLLDTYTDSLVAEAVASADANSAMRENAQILDSVDAGLKMVVTSWSALILSLAELGAFSAAASALAGLAQGLGDVGNAINSIGGLEDGTLSRLAKASSKRMGSSLGLTPVMLYKTLRDAANGELLGPDESKQAGPSPAQQLLDSQRKIGSLTASAQAYQAMGRDTYSKNPQRLLTSFDKSLPAFKELPDGDRAAFEARQEIRPLLESGDMAGARAAIAKRQQAFEAARAAEVARVESTRPGLISTAQADVAGARRSLSALEEEKLTVGNDSAKLADVNRRISEKTALLQNQEEVLKSLSREQEVVALTDPFEKIKGSLSDYTAQLSLAAEEFSKVTAGFGNTGFADLDAKLRIGASRMQGDFYESAIAADSRQNAAGRGEAERLLEIARNKAPNEYLTAEMSTTADDQLIASLQERLALYDQIQSKLDTDLTKIREASREEENRLEYARQAARLQESYDDGATTARSGNERYAIGRSEGEQLVNRTRGSLLELRQNTASAGGDPVTSARQLGQITENLGASKAGLLSLEERMNRALADRANLELEITGQAVKQREEATKRLALASREDQLRAAASAAFLRNNGKSGYSMQEFQYFSQETRGAISNLSPQSVTGLDDTERDNAEARAALDTEITLISSSLAKLRKEFADLRPAAEARGGALGDDLRPKVDGPDTSKREIQLQLSTGEVRLNFDMAPHLQSLAALLEPKIQQQVGAALTRLRRDLSAGTPDTSAAAGVR